MRLRELISRDAPSVGGWCSIPSAFSAELMGTLGFDWICVDTQHGLIGYETMSHMLQALAISGTPSVVRVSGNTPSEIMKALDAGAQGVVVPLVNSADDAASAVSACRYPPAGQRSWGPVRAALGAKGYTAQWANQDVVCIVQIETREAVEALPEILSVPGVDVAYIGPADLAVSYGLAPTFTVADMQHVPVIEEILAACQSHNVVAGIHSSAAVDAVHWVDMGFGFVTAGADRGYMMSAGTREVAHVGQASRWSPRSSS